jgi:hypothetical protein
VSFTPLKKALASSSVAIVTTAAPYRADAGAQGPGAAYNGAAKFYSVYAMASDTTPDLRISHIAYDRVHTKATDINSWFPLQSLQQLAQAGIVGRVCDLFFGLPTNRSHRTTREVDCPDLVSRVRHSGADVCVLVPNCPVCHQSVSLAVVQLEAAGIATVVMGCARDIVETVGVPRFLFSDFPLGNSAGKPHDTASQNDTLQRALRLLETATAARCTVQSPQRWADNCRWKEDYCSVDKLSEQALAHRRAEFDEQKRKAAAQRSASTSR